MYINSSKIEKLFLKIPLYSKNNNKSNCWKFQVFTNYYYLRITTLLLLWFIYDQIFTSHTLSLKMQYNVSNNSFNNDLGVLNILSHSFLLLTLEIQIIDKIR